MNLSKKDHQKGLLFARKGQKFSQRLRSKIFPTASTSDQQLILLPPRPLFPSKNPIYATAAMK